MSTSRSLGAVAELAASQHGVVTRSQAADNQMDHRVVARLIDKGLWRPVGRELLVMSAVPPTWQQRVRLATLGHAADPVAHHATAARLHGVEGFESDDRVMVRVGRGQRVIAPGVLVRRGNASIDALDRLVIDGLPVTTLAATIVDLARTESDRVLERALDDFERRGFSLGWLERTMRRHAPPGGRAVTRLAAEIGLRRARQGRVRGSWFQKLVKECLASPLVPPIEEEHELRAVDGSLIGYLDLAIPMVRLGIEGHSRKHHVGPRVEAYDEHRDNRAAEAGWDLRYVGYRATTETPTQVCRFIERVVARRASDLGVVLPTR